MLEVVVLNPPRRGRSKKKMATKSKRRRRRRNPFFRHTPKGWKAVATATINRLGPARTERLINEGKLVTREYGEKIIARGTGLSAQEKKSAKLAAMREAGALRQAGEGLARIQTRKKAKVKKRRSSKKKVSRKKSRKKTSRKKVARRKPARKKASRKKASRKKVSRKGYSRKKASRKKARRAPAKKAKRRSSKRRSSKRTSFSMSGYRRSKRRATKAKRRKTYGRRKSITLVAGRSYPRRRRAALIRDGYLSKSGRVNPGRRRRRRRKNPFMGGGFGGGNRWLDMGKTLLKAGVGVVGASAIHDASSQLVGMVASKLPAGGAAAKVVRVGGAAATGFATITLARWIESKLDTRQYIGGALTGAAVFVSGAILLKSLLEEFAPIGWSDYVPDMRARALLKIPGLNGMGHMGDWVELRANPYRGVSGMGDLVSPEQLVAGESFARSINEMSGMGLSYPGQYGMGDYRLSMANIRGMGDWVETVEAGAPLDPGTESF